MLNETIEIFKNVLDKQGDELLYNTRVLSPGTYIKVSRDKQSYEIFNITGKDDVVKPSLYKEVAKYDYLSKLVTMDKPVDPKKTIHSNNYMSFFIKKDNLKDNIVDNLEDSKSIHNAIDRYYNAITQISSKKEVLQYKMYDSLEKPISIVDIDMNELEKNKQWIQDNILEIRKHEDYIDDKEYLKIFFEDSDERYINENNRYLIPKVYNSNDYNELINSVLYGLPSNNMQLNSKKPSLRLKTRKNFCPTLVTLDEALLQYKYFDYLMSYASNGERLLYVDPKYGFRTKDDVSDSDNTFSGYVLQLKKGTSLDITKYSPVMGISIGKLNREFRFVDFIEDEKDDDELYGKKTKMKEIHYLVNRIMFSGMLITNYYVEADKISIKNQELKNVVMQIRDAMHNWFYCGKEREGYKILKRYFITLLEIALNENKFLLAKKQLNLMYSLMIYFEEEGEDIMSSILNNRRDLIEKINAKASNEDEYLLIQIKSDKEFYYAVGQIVKYLLSLKNSKKISQSDINNFLSSKNTTVLMKNIERLYEKYNFSIYMHYIKFNRLYSMVLNYAEQAGTIDKYAMLSGFLSDSVFKSEDKNDKNNKNNDIEEEK